MKLTCVGLTSYRLRKKKLYPYSQIVINSSKNTCRISLAYKGQLVLYTSVRRSPEYPGYERRLGIAAYTMALNFGRQVLKQKHLRRETFVLRLKGSQKHAVLGLIDAGLRFGMVRDVQNPSFNGCRPKKTRRL